MMGPDRRTKILIDKKFTVYTILFVLCITGIIVLFDHQKPKVYQNCNQIKLATGRSYIKQGDSLYQYRLDIPHDGIACE